MSNVGGSKGLRRSKRYQRGAAPSSSSAGRRGSVPASRGGKCCNHTTSGRRGGEKEGIQQEGEVH